jgi:hypothetical protein
MKYLFVILVCTLFVSCNQEKLQKQNEAYFIDVIKNQIEINDEIVRGALLSVEAQGNRPADVEVTQGMLALKTGRDILLDETLLNNFEYLNDTLISEYQYLISKICEENDSFTVMKGVQKELTSMHELNQIKKTRNKFEKIIWAYHCLYLESVLLERYATQIWTDRRKSFNGFSDRNISLLRICKLVFIPREGAYESPYNLQIVYNDFTFLIDNVETEIDYELEQVGFAGILSFVPPKKGSYQIRGKSHTKLLESAWFKKNRHQSSDFSYEFEVK